MSVSDPHASPPQTDVSNSKLLRAAMWVAIGALIAAALVCVIWVLIGSQNGLIGRAFLTILLLAGFAAAAILDARLASRRPAWFALTSMVVWVVTLLIGAFLIWMPERRLDYFDRGVARFMSFLLIVLILQLALLHLRLFTKAIARRRTPFTTLVGYLTVGLVAILTVMLVLPLMLSEWLNFHEIYWRIVVAVTILAAVGTALVPLMNTLFAPRRPRVPQPPPGWPTYADGVTPLPVLPDGTPDWNAYYTGYPTYAGYPTPQAPASVPPRQWVQPGQPQPPQSQPGQFRPAQPQPVAPQPVMPQTQQGPPPGWQGYPPPPPPPVQR